MRTSLALLCGVLLLGASLLRGQSRAAGPSLAPEPARVWLQVHDAGGQPIPAHVRVAPLDLAERVRLRMLRDPSCALPPEGRELELAGGAYRVVVSRGPEWSIAQLELRVAPGVRRVQRVRLERELSWPGWLGADLHVHTERSSDAAPHGGVSALALQAEGVDLAVATDHNRIGHLGEGLGALAGAEVTTWQPEIGHFNAFPLQRLPTWRGTTPAALLAELTRDPRVFVQINHPRLDDHIAYFALGGFDGERFSRPEYHLDVHGLEIWNGYDIARPERVQALLREWRGWLARGHRLTATGGSDSHGAHRAGYPRTYVQAAGRDELVPALKAGRAFVSNGPLLRLSVDGAGSGERVDVAPGGELAVEVELAAASWLHVAALELWSERECLWRLQLPAAEPGAARPLRFRARFALRAVDAKLLHLVAHGGTGLRALLGRGDVEPLAFTNPVYLAQPRTPGALARAASRTPPRSGPTATRPRP